MKKRLWELALASLLVAGIGAKPAEAVLIFGSTPFAGALGFTATVAWEVYAPGDATSYLPNADATYDYFYTVTNTSAPSAFDALNNIIAYSVGNPSGSVISSVGSLPIGGIAPTGTFVAAGGTSWFFLSPTICPPGSSGPCGGLTSSDRLFLTSPDGPTPVLGGLIVFGPTASALVPGPVPFIPEPASMGLFGLGLGALGFARRRRKSA